MKKVYNILLLVLALATVTSCTTSNDDYDQERGDTIGFTTPTLEVELPPGGSIPNFNIAFFVTSVSSADRTFQLRVVDELTTLTSDNYSFEMTVTVPANERKGNLAFSATNNSISTTEFQNLVIAFEATEGINSGKQAVVSLRSL